MSNIRSCPHRPASARIGLIITLLAVTLGANHTAAQVACPPAADDGFLQPNCCVAAVPNYPVLPQFNLVGSYFALNSCGLAGQSNVSITFAPAMFPPVLDEEFGRQVTISQPTLNLNYLGDFRIRFVRTFWAHSYALGGGEIQVWRYLVNGDLNPNGQFPTPPATPFPVPPCTSPFSFNRAWFHGFVDYGCRVVSGVREEYFVLNLNHDDGCISHINTPLNNRALAPAGPFTHDAVGYHVVAPATNFAVLSQPTPSFTSVDMYSTLDAIHRSINLNGPLPYSVLAENPAGVIATTQYTTCPCVSGGGPSAGNWFAQTLSGASVACPTGAYELYNAIPGYAPIPTGFIQEYLGFWLPGTNPIISNGTYLLNCFGIVDYNPSSCAPFVSNSTHIVWGNSTVSLPNPGTNDYISTYMLYSNTLPTQLTQSALIMMDIQDTYVLLGQGSTIWQAGWGTDARSEVYWGLSQ